MTDPADREELTYAKAGVSIDAGNALVERIKPHVAKTNRPGILGAVGGFGGMFELPTSNFKQPVMVSGTDGVGTKLRLAIEMDRHETIGIDLVAMCVNDILVCGAEPLWFLDYFATGKLDVDQAADVVSGIAEGCVQAGAALLGGETAEMPGLYADKDYDLAGFAVGVVDKPDIIDGSTVVSDDVLIGLGSSGPHSNGYSLIRKVLEQHDINADFNGQTLGETLIAPTKIYVRSVQALLKNTPVKAMSHITGGGLSENIPRSLPDNVNARIDLNSWSQPAVFKWLQQHGNIRQSEMLRTFNCGIGMILVVSSEHKETAISTLQQQGEQAFVIGSIVPSEGAPVVEYT